MNENISVPAAVKDPLNARELILAYIAKLLNNENPAEPRNTNRVDEAMIYVANLIANGSGGGGGSGLPDVTAEDDGKYLGVDGGAYALVGTPPLKFGNKEVFWVNFIQNPLLADEISCDRTYNEIQAALFDSSKVVFAFYDGYNYRGIAPVLQHFDFLSSTNSYRATYQFFSIEQNPMDNPVLSFRFIDLLPNNSVTKSDTSYTLTPST